MFSLSLFLSRNFVVDKLLKRSLISQSIPAPFSLAVSLHFNREIGRRRKKEATHTLRRPFERSRGCLSPSPSLLPPLCERDRTSNARFHRRCTMHMDRRCIHRVHTSRINMYENERAHRDYPNTTSFSSMDTRGSRRSRDFPFVCRFSC